MENQHDTPNGTDYRTETTVHSGHAVVAGVEQGATLETSIAAPVIPRDPAGRFVRGHSGNPTGRNRRLSAELRALRDAGAKRDFDRLDELARSKNESIALEAVRLKLAYVLGRPVERRVSVSAQAGQSGGSSVPTVEDVLAALRPSPALNPKAFE